LLPHEEGPRIGVAEIAVMMAGMFAAAVIFLPSRG
jgi:hypothetical protein